METKNIALTPEALVVIEALQHNNGTYSFYTNALKRLFNFVLDQSDEIGMSDTEAINTLRALQYIREDLATIANRQAQTPTAPDTEETADKVETVFEGVSLSSQPHPAPVDQLDEPREMLADVKMAWQKVSELQTIISEAITHAQNAGEKYESVISDLADVNSNLETTAAVLDEVMAIDPDNYEPQELTEAERTALFVQRSREVLTYGKELLADAFDHAVRADFKAQSEKISTAKALTGAALNHIAGLTTELNAQTAEKNSKEYCYRLPT